jgi:hypothetical protein
VTCPCPVPELPEATVIQFALLVADQLQVLGEALTVTVPVLPFPGKEALDGETVKLHIGEGPGVGLDPPQANKNTIRTDTPTTCPKCEVPFIVVRTSHFARSQPRRNAGTPRLTLQVSRENCIQISLVPHRGQRRSSSTTAARHELHRRPLTIVPIVIRRLTSTTSRNTAMAASASDHPRDVGAHRHQP